MGKHKVGRPTRYNENYHPQLIELLSRLGYTDKEAAEYLQISERTLNYWKKQHKQFLQSIKKGKNEIINQIEHALYQSAIGYKHPEDKIFYNSTKDKVIIQSTTKHYPPNPVSIIFSLKNLDPKKWRDKQEINVSGGFDVMKFDVPISEEEKQEALKQLRLFFKKGYDPKEDYTNGQGKGNE